MFNLFSDWCKLKNKIHFKPLPDIPYFYEKEVWWCSLGKNIGYEEDGKNDDYSRPVVILKIFSREVLWALPLTTRDKVGKYYHQYEYGGKKYSVILSQLRLISSKRLIRKVGYMPETEFSEMKRRIKELIP